MASDNERTEPSWQAEKEAGNAAFNAKQYLKAAARYSAAIKAFDGGDQDLAVLHSNRCAALLQLSKLEKALRDAERCIELRPDWEKGYFRKGSVLEARSELPEAVAVYNEAVRLFPSNVGLRGQLLRLESLVKKQRQDQRKVELDQRRAAAAAAKG